MTGTFLEPAEPHAHGRDHGAAGDTLDCLLEAPPYPARQPAPAQAHRYAQADALLFHVKQRPAARSAPIRPRASGRTRAAGLA